MLRRILLALGEGETATAAAEVCLTIAKEHKAGVTALASLDTMAMTAAATTMPGFGVTYYPYQSVLDAQDRLIDHARECMKELEEKAEHASVPLWTRVEQGTPADCAGAGSLYHDLVVAGTHSRLHFGVAPTASSPEKTLRHLMDAVACPLLCVTEPTLGSAHVVVALDGRAPSARSLRDYLSSGLLPEARLTVFSCDERGSYPHAERDAVGHYLEAHGREFEWLERKGVARDELMNVLQSEAPDLVVVGAHGKPRLQEWILGSTTRTLLEQCERPIFVGH